MDDDLGSDREADYTASSSPGKYLITASLGGGECQPAPGADRDDACSAEFDVTVRRPSADGPEQEAPANPPGTIPGILADSDGNQYEVFTPVEGGTFTGEGYSLTVGAGAVPNGEFLGIRMSDEGAASNLGMTHQRYTLGGNMYAISAVDSSQATISSYVLDDPAMACVPLPDELRSNISDLALVAINSDGSLTILAAQVRIRSAGNIVCGALSNLPASVAVGSSGAPAAIPTPTPEPTAVPPRHRWHRPGLEHGRPLVNAARYRSVRTRQRASNSLAAAKAHATAEIAQQNAEKNGVRRNTDAVLILGGFPLTLALSHGGERGRVFDPLLPLLQF